MNYNKLLFAALLFIISLQSKAQVYGLNFENCSLSSALGMSQTNGNPECKCGAVNEALSFDGVDDGLLLPDTLLSLLNEDFTIDFYVNINNIGGDQIDIFSIGNDCGIDSLITIKYISSTKEILTELFINNGIYFPVKGKINILQCWNRITLVKSKLNYTLYINNVPQGTAIASQNIPFPKRGKIAFSNSPCLIITDNRLEGNIDELKIYNRPLADREIVQSFIFPEQILTRDTTIFSGSTVLLQFGNTCANTFTWTPSSTLNQDNTPEVTASPDKTTTYEVTAKGNGCIAKDMVTIYVLDPEKQNCENILLPNAFTPNDDRVNDIFKISNPFIIESLTSFEIIDRWGEVLYHTTDKNDGWDGIYLNQRAEPGLYVYRVNYTCKGESYSKLGNVVLLK